MGKSEIMAFGTLIKFVLALAGIIMTLFYIITGLIKKDKERFKKAGLIFIATWVIIILLGAVEFLVLK